MFFLCTIIGGWAGGAEKGAQLGRATLNGVLELTPFVPQLFSLCSRCAKHCAVPLAVVLKHEWLCAFEKGFLACTYCHLSWEFQLHCLFFVCCMSYMLSGALAEISSS